MADKTQLKEEESEDKKESRCKEAEDEAETKKMPTKVVDGKLTKESEDESESELKKEEEEEEESEDKPVWDGKKKKKKEAKKSDGSSQSPEEGATSGNVATATVSPNANVPSKPQDVFVPPSQVNISREQETPMGKSAEPDLMKSPLYLGVLQQLDGIKKAMTDKMDAMEKSMNDRLANTKKELEKFYSQSFYKAIDENVAPEGVQAQSIAKQIENGNVRFRNK